MYKYAGRLRISDPSGCSYFTLRGTPHPQEPFLLNGEEATGCFERPRLHWGGVASHGSDAKLRRRGYMMGGGCEMCVRFIFYICIYIYFYIYMYIYIYI